MDLKLLTYHSWQKWVSNDRIGQCAEKLYGNCNVVSSNLFGNDIKTQPSHEAFSDFQTKKRTE